MNTQPSQQKPKTIKNCSDKCIESGICDDSCIVLEQKVDAGQLERFFWLSFNGEISTDRLIDEYAKGEKPMSDIFERFKQMFAQFQSPADKWIKINGESKNKADYPEVLKEVLLLFKSGRMKVGHMNGWNTWWVQDSNGSNKIYDKGEVTHFQPLPQAPTVKEK